jgi:hypothetical protein
MSHPAIDKPKPSEHAPYYAKYIDLVEGADVVDALATQIDQSLATLRAVPDADSLKRSAAGKWSVREVIGHLVDAERIMAYRALRFARNDSAALPGFEQDDYIAPAHFDQRNWTDLLNEFELVRRADVLMFRGFDEEAWRRRGVANQNEISVRALAYVIAGHELHHLRIIREMYLDS